MIITKKKLGILLGLYISTGLMAQFVPTKGPLQQTSFTYLWARNDTAFAAKGENLWRTTNGGDNWELLLNKGLPEHVDPRAITVARNKVFIGTNNASRVYISNDWGESWTANTNGGSTIWVPTHLTSNGNEVAIGGTTFEPYYFDFSANKWVSSGLSGTTHALRYQEDGTLIANVGSVSKGYTHLSKDNGKVWSQTTKEPEIPSVGISGRVFDVLKIGNRLIAVANLNGYNPYYSDDNGTTWKEASGLKLYSLRAYGRKFIKMPDGTVYLNHSNIYVSKDSGATWNPTNQLAGTDFSLWKTDEILASNARISFAGSGTYAAFKMPETSKGLIVNNGALFTLSNNTSNGVNIWHNYNGNTWDGDSLMESFSTPSIGEVHFTTMVDDTFFICSSSGLISTLKNEIKQQYQSQFGNSQVGTFAKIGTTYLVGTYETRGNVKPKVYYSTDNKKTWTLASFSNTVGFGAGGTPNYFEKFFEHQGKVYADMNGGYAVSEDNGITWKWVGGSIGGNLRANSNAILRINDPVFTPKKVEYSEDGGVTWKSAMEGIPGYTGQNSFINYGNIYEANGIVYLDAWDGIRKLVKFNSSTKKWEATDKVSTLPPVGSLLDLAVYNNTLYANIEDHGVWKQDGSVNISSTEMALLQIFPNPTSGIVNMNVSLDTLSILNSLGKEVLYFNNISNSVDVSLLPSGVYYLQGMQGNKYFCAKLIKQ